MPKILLEEMATSMNGTKKFRKHLYSIKFENNNFGYEGIVALSGFLKYNIYIKELDLINNKIDSLDVAIQLSKAVKSLKFLKSITFIGCETGKHTEVLSEILTACANLEALILTNECIHSEGATVISTFLSSNPRLQFLFLCNNQFNKDDIAKFEKAMKSNRNLQMLELGDKTLKGDLPRRFNHFRLCLCLPN